MGIAAWILWDELDQETRGRVAKVIIHEADRVSCIKPPGNRVEDTKAEENAFNSVILSLAANMFGGHPRAERWREKANVYLMNVHSVAVDVEDNTLVDGRPVKEWVVTENCRPDFLIENHGEVSSGYLVWSTHLRLQSALNYIMTGNAVPEAATFHLDKVYENLLKSGATGDKNEALFYVLFGNADARRIEEKYVKNKMIPGQDDFTDGRFHDQPEPGDVWESESLSYFAYDFLVHYMAGDKAIPLIEFINTACEQPDPAEMKSSVSAEVKLGAKNPGEEKSIPVELITSEEVQEIPAALLMVESDSSVTKILLNGQVPGTRFTGRIDIDEDLAEGPAFFRLTEGSLVDREGRRSNTISVNDTLDIDRTAPPTPLHFKVLK